MSRVLSPYHPLVPEVVTVNETQNLQYVLSPTLPLVPESVMTTRVQDLSLVLPVTSSSSTSSSTSH